MRVRVGVWRGSSCCETGGRDSAIIYFPYCFIAGRVIKIYLAQVVFSEELILLRRKASNSTSRYITGFDWPLARRNNVIIQSAVTECDDFQCVVLMNLV